MRRFKCVTTTDMLVFWSACLSCLSVGISAQKSSAKLLPRWKLKKHLPRQCLSNLFANVIEQISVFALAIPSAVFGNYFGNVVLFN